MVTMDWVTECRRNCDYLIVLYHSGLEHYQYPSPKLQRRCRKMVEKGANFVVCQHSHCIGAHERYLNGDILYGQGNTLFYRQGKNDMWNTAMVVRIVLGENNCVVEYIPTIMSKGSTSLASADMKDRINSSFEERSAQIKSNEIVQKSGLNGTKLEIVFITEFWLALESTEAN